MIKEQELVKMYREWRKANGNQKPNRVIVKKYDDDETPEEARVCTIGIQSHDSWFWNDNPFICYYASTLKGLWQLTIPGNGSDFTITEFLEFYKSPDIKNTRPELVKLGLID